MNNFLKTSRRYDDDDVQVGVTMTCNYRRPYFGRRYGPHPIIPAVSRRLMMTTQVVALHFMLLSLKYFRIPQLNLHFFSHLACAETRLGIPGF